MKALDKIKRSITSLELEGKAKEYMSDVRLNWEGGLKFAATGSANVSVQIDGDRQEGTSPMELLLEALGGCTSIDIVAILEKMRQPLERFEIGLSGTRRDEDPKSFTAIELVGCQNGLGLPQPAPFSAAIEITHLIGIRGIEVIGATARKKIEIS